MKAQTEHKQAHAEHKHMLKFSDLEYFELQIADFVENLWREMIAPPPTPAPKQENSFAGFTNSSQRAR